MTLDALSSVQREVWQTMVGINRAWLEGNPETLLDFFHEEMVIHVPAVNQRAVGKEACMQSYKDFCEQGKVLEFEPGPPAIDVFGGTAIVNYTFHVAYSLAGNTYREQGSDLMVFQKQEDRWLAIWRTSSSQSETRESG